MSDETHDVDEQLFDIDETEVADDATDTTDSQTQKETEELKSETEQEQEGLELETDKTPTKAEEKKLAMIKKWQKDIDDGKKSIKDLPKAQSWLKSYLKDSDSELEVDHKAIAKELAKEAIKEERAEIQFADLFDTLKAMKLTKAQMVTINEKFKLFKEKGLSQFESLSLASEIASVDFTGLAEKKRRMSIPQPSTKKPTGEIDIDDTPFSEVVGNVPQEKINEHLRNLVK